MFKQYLENAKKRGLAFVFPIEEFRQLTSQKCFYCDEDPKEIYNPLRKDRGERHRSYYGTIKMNRIDRLNNEIGYTKENSVACCRECNFMKKNLNVSDFIQKCSKIANCIINKTQKEKDFLSKVSKKEGLWSIRSGYTLIK